MLLHDVEVDGHRVDVRVASGVVTEVGVGLPGKAAVNGGGAALIPGLHDHHIHLMATAAARVSVQVGAPTVRTPAGLRDAMQQADTYGGWVRAVGYDEAVAGELDRYALDRMCHDRPVRVQHRSGALWVVNSAGAALLALDSADRPGIERDEAGHATGRLWRADPWLTQLLGHAQEPDLARLGTELAAAGVTGVTDATPSMPRATAELLASAHRKGDLPQRITVLAADLDMTQTGGLALGPAKLVVADHRLPGLDELVASIVHARAEQRAVAVHCVTREALLLALSALADAGSVPGDRIEHAAVAPPEAIRLAAELGVVVVTQPSLVADCGDDYLDRTENGDREHLWPWQSFRRAGVPVAGSSDAPYGDTDPWAGMRAAVWRTTPSGRVTGSGERVTPEVALAGWLTPAHAPGDPIRRVEPGTPADLALLNSPLAEALADPHAGRVVLTMIGGCVVYEATNTKGDL